MYFQLLRDPPLNPPIRADLRVLGAETYNETVGTITPELPLLDKSYVVEQRGNKAIIHRFTGSIPANKSPVTALQHWAFIKQYADENWELYNIRNELVAKGYFHRGLRLSHPVLLDGQSQRYTWNADFIQEGPVEPALLVDPMPHAFYRGERPVFQAKIPITLETSGILDNLPAPPPTTGEGEVPLPTLTGTVEPQLSNYHVRPNQDPQGRFVQIDFDVLSTKSFTVRVYATFVYILDGRGPTEPLTNLVGTVDGNFAERFRLRAPYKAPINAINGTVTVIAELNNVPVTFAMDQRIPI